MSESPEQTQSSETPADGVFKGYKDAYKALRTLHPPITDAARADYIRKLRQAKSARYIAFRFLALRAVGEMQMRLSPFLSELETILLKDSTRLELTQCGSVDDVRKAVMARLSDLRNKPQLKEFATSGHHLPIFYAIIRMWDQPAKFQAALDALAESLDRITKSKRAQKPVPSNNLEIVARALIARVPEKPLVGKAVPELLKIAQAVFRQSEETARENLNLQSQLAQAVRETESLRTQLDTERDATRNLDAELTAAKRELNRLEAKLKQETEYFETLKAHGESERQVAVRDAVARLRSEVSRRIENIRLFADREIPNRQGILNLVKEIETLFADKTGEKS